MTVAPLAASVASSASVASAPRQSTPSVKPIGRWRDTTRTDSPSPARRALRARPTCPAPKITCWLFSFTDTAVPAFVVGLHTQQLRQHRQGGQHDVLDPYGRRGHPALVAEVPERGAELKRVLRRPARGRPAVGDQAGDGLVELFGVQGRS